MAQRLNKKLVAGLTVAGMVITTAAAIVMVMTLPEQDPAPAAAKAEEAAASGDYAAAVQWYQKAYQRSRSGGEDTASSNEYLVRMGDMALAQGDARQALGAWQKAILNNPHHEEAQQKIVEFQLELANMRWAPWSTVQSAAEALQRINPQNYTGLHALGLALINQRNIKEENLTRGGETLRQAFEGDRSNSEFADSLARHYFQEGQPEKAMEVYDELMAHLPKDPESRAAAWRHRGRFYVVKKAREQLELEQKRKDRAAPAELTQLEERINKSNTEALRCLNQAVEFAPGDVDNLIALGDYWGRVQPAAVEEAERKPERQYALAKAEGFYKQAIQANPDGYEAYLRLARLHLLSRDLDDALQVLNERRKRGIQREGYLGPRNKWYMSALRNEMFTISMAQSELYRQLAKDRKSKEMQEIIARLEEIYQEQRAEVGEEDPGALFMKGRLLSLEGNPVAAIKAMEKAEKLLPDTMLKLKLKQYLAQVYLEVKEYGAAQEALSTVLQAYPNNVSAWTMMAGLQVEMGDLGKAQQAAERALAINPNHRNALLVMMNIYERQKNWDKVREIQKALAKKADTKKDKLQRAVIYRVQALSGDEPDQALLAESERLLREVLEAEPLHWRALRQLLLILARDPERAGELQKLVQEQEAIARRKLAEAAAATQPSDDELAKYRSRLASIERLNVLADPEASQEDKYKRIEEIIKRGEGAFMVAMELYQLYTRTPDRADEALAQLKKAHELRPSQKSVVESLFRTALQRKDWAMAEEFMKKAIALGLDPSGGHFYRGRLLMARRDQGEDHKAAVEHFRAGLADYPTYSQGHLLLASALAEIGQYDEAKRSFQESLRLNPRNSQAVLGLASLAALRGREAEKIKYLNICSELIPNHPWVKAQLQILQDARDPKQSIARREEIRKSDPKDGNNLYRLARLYEQGGQYAKAKALFEECCQLDPENLRLVGDYARFLRTKTPPEADAATQMLREKVQNTDADQKAAAQLVLATHLEALSHQGGAEAPDQKTCDAAYEAAAEMSDWPAVRMDIGMYYLTNLRFDQAEEWFRKALAAAEAGKRTANEKKARELLIDAMLQSRNPAREEDLKKELDTYEKKYDHPFILMARGEYYANAGHLEQALDLVGQYIDRQPEDPLGYFKRGDINFQRSLWQEAIEDYRTTKALRPAGYGYEHRLRLARCLENLGQDELAVLELLSILADERNQMTALRQLFDLYLKMKRWNPAEKMILARLKKEPDAYRWPLLLLDLYRASGDADKAIKYGRQAADKSRFLQGAVEPLLDVCLEFKRYEDLVKFVNKTLPADKRETPQVLLKTAIAYAAQGERLRALERYNRVLDLLTGQIGSFSDIASDLVRRMGAEEARKAFQTRLAQKPDERASKFVLSRLQRDAGGMDAFVTTVKGLLETVPADDPQAVGEKLFLMQSLATSYGQAGDYENARKTYEEMLKINPYHVVALNNLAYVLIDHFNDAKSALPYAQQAAQLLPNEPNILDTLGWNFTLLGEYDKAIVVLRHSIGINDGVAAVHYHAAEAFFQRANKNAGTRDADLREAQTECRRAHELIMSAGRDTEGLFDKVIALGDKLGLTLDKKPPGS